MPAPNCLETVYSPTGRRGLGVNQPQSGLNYPLVQPSPDIRGLLADLWLVYAEQTAAAVRQPPFWLAWLYGFGCDPADNPRDLEPTHAADVLILGDADQVVCDSTLATSYRYTDVPDYRIHEWFLEAGYLRILQYSTWPADGEIAPHEWPLYLAPLNGEIDPRAV